MTGLERAHLALSVASIRDQLRGGHLDPALAELTTMERGDLVGLINRAMDEDGGIDGARLATSERQRAEAWLRSAAAQEPTIKGALEAMSQQDPKLKP
jgi:hypothetical protein